MKVLLFAIVAALAVVVCATTPTPPKLPPQYSMSFVLVQPKHDASDSFMAVGTVYVNINAQTGRTDLNHAGLVMSEWANYTNGAPNGPSQLVYMVPELGNEPRCTPTATQGSIPTSTDALADAKFVGFADWYGQTAYEWLIEKDDSLATLYTDVGSGVPVGLSSFNTTTDSIQQVMSLFFAEDDISAGVFDVPSLCGSPNDLSDASLAADVKDASARFTAAHALLSFLA